ncbi:NUA4L dehydrogenase, partial [Pygoscelis papua]
EWAVGLGAGPVSPTLLTGSDGPITPCSWDRKNNPEPWNKLSPTDQYKFLAVSTDYKSLKKDRPNF